MIFITQCLEVNVGLLIVFLVSTFTNTNFGSWIGHLSSPWLLLKIWLCISCHSLVEKHSYSGDTEHPCVYVLSVFGLQEVIFIFQYSYIRFYIFNNKREGQLYCCAFASSWCVRWCVLEFRYLSRHHQLCSVQWLIFLTLVGFLSGQFTGAFQKSFEDL